MLTRIAKHNVPQFFSAMDPTSAEEEMRKLFMNTDSGAYTSVETDGKSYDSH